MTHTTRLLRQYKEMLLIYLMQEACIEDMESLAFY